MSTDDFTLATWNILADCHATGDAGYYPYCSEEDLYVRDKNNPKQQTNRCTKLLDQIREFDADILCLQEVEVDFFGRLQAMLGGRYTCLFLMKTMGTMEGVAVCIRNERFSVVASRKLAYKDLLAGICGPAMTEETRSDLAKDSVMLAVCVQCKLSGKRMVVGNVHIIFNDFCCPDVQALQAALFSQQLVQLASDQSCAGDADIPPCLLCGDFNTTPGSLLYRLLVNGCLEDAELEDLFACVYAVSDSKRDVHLVKRETRSKCELLQRHFSVPISWKSAYMEVNGCEPETTCQDSMSSLPLDYIFYGPGMQVQAVGKVSSYAAFSPGGPRESFPSDHLPLTARITIGRDEMQTLLMDYSQSTSDAASEIAPGQFSLK